MGDMVLLIRFSTSRYEVDDFEIARIIRLAVDTAFVYKAILAVDVMAASKQLDEINAKYLQTFCSSLNSADQTTLQELFDIAPKLSYGPIRGVLQPLPDSLQA